MSDPKWFQELRYGVIHISRKRIALIALLAFTLFGVAAIWAAVLFGPGHYVLLACIGVSLSFIAVIVAFVLDHWEQP